MRNSDKKLIIILVALIIILIICIILFMVLTGNGKTTTKGNNSQYTDEDITVEYKDEGKYKPSVINDDYTIMSSEEIQYLDNNIDDIIEKINSKNYEELYYMVPDVDRKIKFSTFDEFKDYINKLFTADSYKCASYRIDDYNCYLKLIGDGESESGDGNTIDLKIIGYKVKESAEIHFENINYAERTLTYINTSKIAFNMQYLVEYDDKMTAMFLIQNKNDEAKNITIEELKLIKVINGVEDKTVSKQPESVEIPAKGNAKLEVIMDTEENLMYMPDVMEIKIKINGEVKQFRVQVVYPSV